MAKLTLCFPSEETGRRRPLNKGEIDEIAMAAQSITAIAEVMQEYACNIKEDNARNAMANCMDVFTILEWLIRPVAAYLSEYAGEEAAPEEEPEQTA
jgi:hypothetical protein